VGALFGLLDYDSNKGAHLTRHNKSIITSLINATQQFASWSFRLAKIGCLVSLAKHEFTREELIKQGGLSLFQQKETDILLQYLNRLGLAHLLAENEENIETELLRASIDLIEEQFQSSTPRNIRDKESEHGVVWSSMRHVLRLLRSEIQVLPVFGLFCLANMSFSSYNRKLMIDENVIGAVVCLGWKQPTVKDCHLHQFSQTYLNIILENFRGTNPTISLVPTLVEIVQFNVYHNYKHLKSNLLEIEKHF